MNKIIIKNKHKQEKEYYCEYEIKNNKIEVKIGDLDIREFIENENPEINNYDISKLSLDGILIDSSNSNIFYLKDMYYTGEYHFAVSISATKFSTCEILKTHICNREIIYKIFEEKRIKVESIRIYTQDLLNYIVNDNFKFNDNFSKIEFLNNESTINIRRHNIKELTIKIDNKRNVGKEGFYTDFLSFIQISFIEEKNLKDIYKYLKELLLYLKLYGITKLEFNHIYLKINGKYMVYYHDPLINCNQNIIKYENNGLALDEFIQNCYQKFHDKNKYYNKYFNDIFIIFNHSYLYQEDIFLMYYRFVEFYYKTENDGSAKQVDFIKELLDNYLDDNDDKLDDNDDKLDDNDDKIDTDYEAIGIVSLRNHYVHNGYYIKNNKIKKTGPKRGTIKTSPTFINQKTELLKEVVINIILKKILN